MQRPKILDGIELAKRLLTMPMVSGKMGPKLSKPCTP
jgi:hypothetical protein